MSTDRRVPEPPMIWEKDNPPTGAGMVLAVIRDGQRSARDYQDTAQRSAIHVNNGNHAAAALEVGRLLERSHDLEHALRRIEQALHEQFGETQQTEEL